MQIGCFGAAVGLIGIVLAMAFIQDNPWVIYVIAIVIAGLIWAYQAYKKKLINKSVQDLYALRPVLVRFSRGFEQIDGSYLSLRKGEIAFYERDGVQLVEYKSAGSTTSGGYLGGNLRLTNSISISGGGFEGSTTPNPEEAKIIDTGKVTFTTQRAIFVGPNHTREFDFDKILDLNISENGFVVRAAVSGRQKTSALQADASGGLPPGMPFAFGVEYFQGGESEARAAVDQVLRDLDDQYRRYVAGELKP